MERAEQYATSWTPEGRRKVEEREEGTGNERQGKKGQGGRKEAKGWKQKAEERAEQYAQSDSKEGEKKEKEERGKERKESQTR